MFSIKKEEDGVFQEYAYRAKVNHDPIDEIAKDGLTNRGKIVQGNNGYWYRLPGNEEKLWSTSMRKILYVTKDPNDDSAWDMREETGRKNKETSIRVTSLFYKGYMRINYLLHNTTDKYHPTYEEADEHKLTFYEKQAVVRINIKKQPGKGTLKNQDLKRWLNIYGDIITKQIHIYAPNIIYCAGGSSIIREYITKHYLKVDSFQKVNDWIYYSEKENITVIDGYHFSYRSHIREHYEELAQSYQVFLKELM